MHLKGGEWKEEREVATTGVPAQLRRSREPAQAEGGGSARLPGSLPVAGAISAAARRAPGGDGKPQPVCGRACGEQGRMPAAQVPT